MHAEIENPVEGVLVSEAYDDTGVSALTMKKAHRKLEELRTRTFGRTRSDFSCLTKKEICDCKSLFVFYKLLTRQIS